MKHLRRLVKGFVAETMALLVAAAFVKVSWFFPLTVGLVVSYFIGYALDRGPSLFSGDDGETLE